MSSLLTNTSAMTALQTLTTTNKRLGVAQNRISTGLRVTTAADNAAYWSIATTMRSDKKAIGAVQDALGLGAATIDTMYTGLTGSVEVVSEIKAKLVAARQPGVDKQKIQDEISQLQTQLKNSADATVFNGESWLSVDSDAVGFNATKSIVSSFSRAGGVVSIDTVQLDTAAIKLYDANADAAYKAVAPGSWPGVFLVAPPPLTVTIEVRDGPVPTIHTIQTPEGTTTQDLAHKMNALDIEGFTVGVTGDGTSLRFNNRGLSNIFISDMDGVGPNNGMLISSYGNAAVETQKGILDKTYDVFLGTRWTTFSVSDLDISDLTDSPRDTIALEVYIRGVDRAVSDLTKAASTLGAIKNRVGMQQDFVKALSDSLDRGIGQLVDADMNAESTRLQALQVQQQLGIQALSIANGNGQSILSLFRN